MLKYEDVLTAPEKVDFVFQAMDSWRQSGNFPVGNERLNMVSTIRVHNMSCFDILFQMYFTKYIKYVVIPETNKFLKYPVVLSEYFRVIGCNIIMEC